MDKFDKAKIYMKYYITQLGLKNFFHVVDMSKDNWQHGRSKPDKTFKNIAFYYLWKDLLIQNEEEIYNNIRG